MSNFAERSPWRKLLPAFLKPGEHGETVKIWSKKFRKAEKLAAAKSISELEPVLLDLVAWLGDESVVKMARAEWWNQTGLLAQAYSGNFTLAEKCFRYALDAAGRGDDRHGKLLAMTNLGVLFLDQNRSDEAVGIFLTLKPLIEESFGPESRETATVCQNLASALRLANREEEAREERIRATRILRSLS